MKNLIFVIGAGHAHSNLDKETFVSTTDVSAQDDLVNKDKLLLTDPRAISEESARQCTKDSDVTMTDPYTQKQVHADTALFVRRTMKNTDPGAHIKLLCIGFENEWVPAKCEDDGNNMVWRLTTKDTCQWKCQYMHLPRDEQFMRKGPLSILTLKREFYDSGFSGQRKEIMCENGEKVGLKCNEETNYIEPLGHCPQRSSSDECLLGDLQNYQYYHFSLDRSTKRRFHRFSSLTGRCKADGSIVTAKCVNQRIKVNKICTRPSKAFRKAAPRSCESLEKTWTDRSKNTCDHYKKYDLCTEFSFKFVDSKRKDGYTAYEACCGCKKPTRELNNLNLNRAWLDSQGRDCDDYRINDYCTKEGAYGTGWKQFEVDDITGRTFEDYARDGHTAWSACKKCGADTFPDADAPACKRLERSWMDWGGWTCGDYVQNEWCTIDGGYGKGWSKAFKFTFDDFEFRGHTALTACCGCGAATPSEP